MAFRTQAVIPGMTQEVYEGLFQQVGAQLRVAPGFIAHIACPAADGWDVIEIWESEEAAMTWLNEKIFPMMQGAGVLKPDIQGRQVQNLVIAGKD